MPKFGGKQVSNVNTRGIALKKGGEEVNILLASQSPGFSDKLSSLGLMDRPSVPRVQARDKQGRVVRDPITSEIQFVDNPEDKKYLAALNVWSTRWTALLLREYMRLDQSIEFDTSEPTDMTKEAWQAYADSLAAELFGPNGCFTDSESSYIINEGRKLGVQPVSVDEVVDDFLAPE